MLDLILINTPLRDYGRSPKRSQQTLPVLGLAYIATYAEEAGFSVDLLDAEALGISVQEVIERVNSANPRWVGLNLLAPTYELSVEIMSGLSPHVQIMLGGHQAKALPQRILADTRVPRIDALILGEAELRVAEILRSSDAISRLPNVLSRRSTDVTIMPRQQNAPNNWLAPDVDALPFVDRKFLPNDPFLAEDGRWEANIVGSRGCPFNCSFCGAAISANPDVTIRMRSIDNILDELRHLRDLHDCTAFRFVDDLFLANPKYLRRTLDGFEASDLHSTFVWDATGRINVIDKLTNEDIARMKSSGCREIALGIESGSDRLLEYIDKKLSRGQITRVVRSLLEAGINVKGYFIFGFPTETRSEFEETVSLIHELWQTSDGLEGRFRCSVFEFRPYPGTPEWNRLVGEYGFDEQKLLAYAHADIEAGEQRDQFNFSSDLQFGDVALSDIRAKISEIMQTQSERIGGSNR